MKNYLKLAEQYIKDHDVDHSGFCNSGSIRDFAFVLSHQDTECKHEEFLNSGRCVCGRRNPEMELPDTVHREHSCGPFKKKSQDINPLRTNCYNRLVSKNLKDLADKTNELVREVNHLNKK